MVPHDMVPHEPIADKLMLVEELNKFEVLNFASIDDCSAKGIETPELCMEDGFHPGVCSLNNQVNICGLNIPSTVNTFKSGKGGLSPVCEIKWMMSTKIRKEFVLDHQNHPNSGKKKWMCKHHVSSSIAGTESQMQTKIKNDFISTAELLKDRKDKKNVGTSDDDGDTKEKNKEERVKKAEELLRRFKETYFKGESSKIRKRSLSETLQKKDNSIKKKKKALIKKIEQEVELNRKLKRKQLE